MAQSKKDFEALAEALRICRPRWREYDDDYYQTILDVWNDCRNEIMHVCAASNPRFNRDRFIEWSEK